MSLNRAVITDDGMVTRPMGNNEMVTLRASLTKGDVTETKDFDLTVLAAESEGGNTDADDVAQVKADLAIGFASMEDVNNVKSNLTLPTPNTNGVDVSWTSGTPGVIANNGTVTRPAASASYAVVTLTAMLEKNAAMDTREFKVIVIAQPTTAGAAVLYGDYKVYADSTANSGLTQLPLKMGMNFQEFNQPSRQEIPRVTTGSKGANGSTKYVKAALTTAGAANWGINFSGAGGGDNTDDTHYDATAAPSKLCMSLRSPASGTTGSVGHVGVRLADLNGSTGQTTYAVATFTPDGTWKEVCLPLNTATFPRHGMLLDGFDRIVFIYLDADDNTDTTPDETQKIDVDEVVLRRLTVDELE